MATKIDPQEELVEEFAEYVSEFVLDHSSAGDDPLVAYAHLLRARLHVNEDRFRSRFMKGYRTLLELLQKPSDP